MLIIKVLVYGQRKFINLTGRTVDLRPLTDDEVRQHLKDFGLTRDYVTGKVERLSAGQKSRLVLAAAMWNRPHFVVLDEPTNYLVWWMRVLATRQLGSLFLA